MSSLISDEYSEDLFGTPAAVFLQGESPMNEAVEAAIVAGGIPWDGATRLASLTYV